MEKIAPPSSEGEEGEVGEPRNLFPRLGVGCFFCTWGRLEPAFGGYRRRGFSGWSVQPKGLVRWHQPVLIRCIVRAHGQTSARYTQVRTTTTTTTTRLEQVALPFFVW